MPLVPSKLYPQSDTVRHYVDHDRVIGFQVVSPSPGVTAYVVPIYAGEVHVKQRWRGRPTTTRVFDTHEHGTRLNRYTHDEDPVGYTLATIAAEAIRALEYRSWLMGNAQTVLRTVREKSKPKPKRRAKKR